MFLVEREVGEWMELPLWISSPDSSRDASVGNARAVEAGLTFRPLEDTIRATLADAELTDDAGMKPEREQRELPRRLARRWRPRKAGAAAQRSSSRLIRSGSTPRASASASVSNWNGTMSTTGCTVGISSTSHPSTRRAATASCARSAARPSPSRTKQRTLSSTAAR